MIKILPNYSFTYLCPSRTTAIWLDHILSTFGVAQWISEFFVSYESAMYDNFLLHFNCQFSFDIPDCSPPIELVLDIAYWSKLSAANKKRIRSIIDDMIEGRGLLCHDLFYCTEVSCSDANHLLYLDEILRKCNLYF